MIDDDLYSVSYAPPSLGLVLRVTAIGAAVGVVLIAAAVVIVNKLRGR